MPRKKVIKDDEKDSSSNKKLGRPSGNNTVKGWKILILDYRNIILGGTHFGGAPKKEHTFGNTGKGLNVNPKCVVEVIISRRLPDIRVQTALKLHVIFSFFDKNKPIPYCSKFWRTLKKF
jgi:hypothetical protein